MKWIETRKRNTRSDSWIICFLLYSGADIASQSRHMERLFHVAATLCHNIEMAQRAFVALWAIFVLLNGLAAIVVFGCLEFFLFRFPFCELSLTLFALVVYHNVGKESTSDTFDGVLRNIGVVDELFTSTQEFLLRIAGGWIWRCLRCLWRLCSASILSFCCMKKADPVSSKSLYRCLRVLDVFGYLYYSKKDVFCQDLAGISFVRT